MARKVLVFKIQVVLSTFGKKILGVVNLNRFQHSQCELADKGLKFNIKLKHSLFLQY